MLRKKITLPFINLLFAVSAYLAYQYYSNAQSHAHTQKQVNDYIVLGIALYCFIAVVIVVRAFLKSKRGYDSDESGAEVSAMGMLGASRLKNVELTLNAPEVELNQIDKENVLVIARNRFQMPIRHGDKVQIRSGDGAQLRLSYAVIDKIDGVNLTVVLKKQPS